jgi:hypothetical protein
MGGVTSFSTDDTLSWVLNDLAVLTEKGAKASLKASKVLAKMATVESFMVNVYIE